MIKEQNYIKIAEYTKKALQVFCKRALANQILQMLGRPRARREACEEDSQVQIENESIAQSQCDKKDQNQGKTSNMRFTKQTASPTEFSNASTLISTITYGDFISFEQRNQLNHTRITAALDTLKLANIRDLMPNNVNLKKSCFQVCSPCGSPGAKGHPITSDSMVLLRNTFNGHYLNFTEYVAPSVAELGYAVRLQQHAGRSAVVRLMGARPGTVRTDQKISVGSYYNRQLYLNVSQQSLQQLTDRTIFASHSPNSFRVSKAASDLRGLSYYFIHCVGINRNIQATELPFTRGVQRRQYRLQVECNQEERRLSLHDMVYFAQLNLVRQGKEVQVAEPHTQSLYQVWQLQRTHSARDTMTGRIKNVLTGQSLVPERDPGETESFKRSSILRFKQAHNSIRNEFTISGQDNLNLSAVFDAEKESYVLRLGQEQGLQRAAGMGRTSVFKFQLVELQPERCELLAQMIEFSGLLRSNYSFLERWGWNYDERECRIRYSLLEMKVGVNLVRGKVAEVAAVVLQLRGLLLRQQGKRGAVQQMARQTHILELLVIYCEIVDIKQGKGKSNGEEVYQLAVQELKPLQKHIFEVLYLLVQDCKSNSQIIIENSPLFNHLLRLYPQTIGALLQEAIKNLCLLTAKIPKEELVFEWTRLVDFIMQTGQLDVQRKYIDIVAEVAIDPGDVGIPAYQNKIREQLFGRAKRKVFPRFQQSPKGVLSSPLLCFDYSGFPIKIELLDQAQGICFELLSLYSKQTPLPQYRLHIDYICSILKLFRNLSKDRNRRMPKVVEQYGLTQTFLQSTFRHPGVGWEMVARFLDLYCAVYLVQDPFLSFEKREVRCFVGEKISEINFSVKTGILFKQFTEELTAIEKHKQFNQHVLPLLERYFKDLNDGALECRAGSFGIIVGVVFQLVDYGYLCLAYTRKYVGGIIKQTGGLLRGVQDRQTKQRILLKMIQLCRLTEQISTIIQGMNLLKQIHRALKQSNRITVQTIQQQIKKALEDDQPSLQTDPIRRRHFSMGRREERYRKDEDKKKQDEEPCPESPQNNSLNLIEFSCQVVLGQIDWTGSRQAALGLLQLLSQRGQRLCGFLAQTLVLGGIDEERLFLQYSGISPQGNVLQGGSSRRLLNVMKVKELVQRITQEEGEQERKKEKILELSNLLVKIMKNLEELKGSNAHLFSVCQSLLQKLGLHSVLIAVLRYTEREAYQGLIGQIIGFFCEFIYKNKENTVIMAQHFPQLTAKYAYTKLPLLLPAIFSECDDQEKAFWIVYGNVEKKMDHEHREILFDCIYRILLISTPDLFQKIKGQVIYSLTSLKQLRPSIRAQILAPKFVELLCLVGRGAPGVERTVKELVCKSVLLAGLQSSTNSYPTKRIFLQLYYFLYLQSEDYLEDLEADILVEKIFVKELLYLPATCRSRAEKTIAQIEGKVSQGERGPEWTQQMKGAIKAEFGSLMLEGTETVHASEEEDYLNYLLGVQGYFSMLGCMEATLSKFRLWSVGVLANLVFRLINFMDKLYTHEQRTYQTQILTRLYSIADVLKDRYECREESSTRLLFPHAHSVVQTFYRSMASLIRIEGISFAQILRCGDVTEKQLQDRRNEGLCKVMVLQSQFAAFINRLRDLVNNRTVFSKLLSEGSVKSFFLQVRQKGQNRIDLLDFLAKLSEVMEHERNIELRKIQSNHSTDEAKSIVEKDVVNSVLIVKQISCLRKTYEMTFGDMMQGKIKLTLGRILQVSKHWTLQNMVDILQLAIECEKLSISKVVVRMAFAKLHLQEIAIGSASLVCEKYLKLMVLMVKEVDTELDPRIIRVIASLYQCNKDNKQFLIELGKSIVSFGDIARETISRVKQTNTKNSDNAVTFLEHFYVLISNCLQNTSFPSELEKTLQSQMAQLLSDCFLLYRRYHNSLHFRCCQLLVTSLIQCFENFKYAAQVLSSNQEWINQSGQALRKLIGRGVFCVNYLQQQQMRLLDRVCVLLAKMRARQVTSQLVLITQKWPFDLIFDAIKNSYTGIISQKLAEHKKCDSKTPCTQQYCNKERMTHYDEEIIQTLSNMLVVVCIIADLTFDCEIQISEKAIIRRYGAWRQGQCLTSLEQEKVFRVVQSIDVGCNGGRVYFSVPMVDKFRKDLFQKQLGEEMMHFKRQKFFESLNKLSLFVEQELQLYQIQGYGFLSRYSQPLASSLQIILIIYLFALCFSELILPSISKITECFFNGLFLILKTCLFVRNMRRFLGERRMLGQIEYQKYVLFWKYFRFASGLISIVCYCLIFKYQAAIPITLLLQLYRIQLFQKMISVTFQAFKYVAYILILYEAIIFACVFMVDVNGYQGSTLDIYVQIQRQVGFFQGISINAQDPSSFPILKNIPLLIPLFSFLIQLVQAVFVGSVFQQLGRRSKREAGAKEESCRVCGCSRGWCQERGINFTIHTTRQHNPWIFIYFFIYLRKRSGNQLFDRLLQARIQRGDFQFLQQGFIKNSK